ncbi:V-ATPase V1 sector subunit E [Podila humilis]|nr:V-ATPase V1 sector subunit E [Podila humilis]
MSPQGIDFFASCPSHLQRISRRSSAPQYGPSPFIALGQHHPRAGISKSGDSSRRNSFADTCMEIESSVLFNVNPPSPQESEYYSDEQDIILRTWHSGGGAIAEHSRTYAQSMPHHLTEKGYFGLLTTSYEQLLMSHDGTQFLSRNQSLPLNETPLASHQDPNSAHALQDATHSPRGSLSAPSIRGNVVGFRPSESSSSTPPGHAMRRSPQQTGRGARTPGDSNRKSELYKTELCISLSTGNPCRYGDQCQFAHSKEELQHVHRHPRYKTQFCLSFQAHGYCKYNERCTFIHRPEEARVPLSTIPGRQSPAEKDTEKEASAGAKTPRMDRARALSDPGHHFPISRTDSSADDKDQSISSNTGTQNRCRSNAVSYPPELLYNLAHPQIAQFTERENAARAFTMTLAHDNISNVPLASPEMEVPSGTPEVPLHNFGSVTPTLSDPLPGRLPSHTEIPRQEYPPPRNTPEETSEIDEQHPCTMSFNKALNDEEVFSEMRKMVAFIKQEALEKAREIKVKVINFCPPGADEEFNIEKAKLVRQEAINIDAAFQRKVKQADVQRRIAQSNNINKSRMTILLTRQQMLDDLFAESRNQLLEVSKDTARYENFVADALVQAFFRLLESEVTVKHRKSDKATIEKLLPDVKSRYEEATKQNIKVILLEEHLPADSAGGVIVAGNGGRTVCNNTPEARLAILEEDMLPDVRNMLFGQSPNRKFFN